MKGAGKGQERIAVSTAALLLAFSLSALPSQAQSHYSPNALPPVLKRALAAARSLRYTGRRTVVVRRDGTVDRHEEIVSRNGLQVRIEFPREGDYAGQVIVESGGQRRHFLPATNEVQILPARREQGLQRLRALVRSGSVEVRPGERIAGYATTLVTIRDAASNPLQRLSIEPASGMILRRQVFDATGVEVGGFVFTKVDLTPSAFDPALFRIERRGVQTTTPSDTLRRLAKRNGFAPVGLPEATGFRLDAVRIARPAGVPVLLQTYADPDGGRLSLYQFRSAVDPAALRRNGGRRLNTLSWTDAGTTYVLLGPQSDAVLARLKEALGPRP